MRYRMTFEFDSDNDPSMWYWRDLLSNVNSDADPIDWSTVTLEKKGNWIAVGLDSI